MPVIVHLSGGAPIVTNSVRGWPKGAHHHGSANEAIDPLLRQGVEDGFEGHGIGDPQLSEGIDEFGLNALDLGLS
ncbi:hypothetical protein ACVWZZ_001934 [Bradyrhizobium sp. LM6.10]